MAHDHRTHAAYGGPEHGNWQDPEQARRYAERIEARDVERAPLLRLMAALIPFDAGVAVRVLDLGTGLGSAVAAVLDAFPQARAIGLDISEAMIEQGRVRLQRYAERLQFQLGDIAGGIPADVAGPFDAIISAIAIHHVPVEQKRVVYASAHERLNAGGVFLNLDYVQPPDAYLIERYQAAQEQETAATRHAGGEGSDGPPRHMHGGRLDEHLAWLRDAGFTSVDCFAKQLNLALMGGYRR